MSNPKKNIENIRIGGENDGGYIVPNDLKDIKYCFSPGVGSVSKFEEELTQKKIKCFLADYSVDLQFESNLIEFDKKFIGPSTFGNFLSLKDWIKKKNVDGSRPLQIQ